MFGNNPLNAPFAKIAIKISPYQLKIEIGLVLIFLLGLLLKSYSLPSGQIIILSLGILSSLYAILSFKEYSNDNKWYHHFSSELIYKAFSILIISTLFSILHWPGGDFFINIGIGGAIIGNLVKIYLELKKDKTYDYLSQDLIRTLVVICSCAFFQYYT